MTQRQVDLQRLIELEQQRHYQDLQEKSEIKETLKNIQNPLQETMNSLEKDLNLDIFLSDKDFAKKKIKRKLRSIVRRKLKQEIS